MSHDLYDSFARAISIAYGTSHSSSERRDAEMRLNELQQSPEAWNLLQSVLFARKSNTYECFWIFQLVVEELSNFRKRFGEADLQSVYFAMQTWIKDQVPDSQFPRFLIKKCVQAQCACLFCSDSNEFYKIFFRELFSYLESPVPSVKNLFFLLWPALNEYIAAEEMHSLENINRNVKEYMRAEVLVRLIETVYRWIGELTKGEEPNASMFLDLLEPYITWVDVSLVSSKEWLCLHFELFKDNEACTKASDLLRLVVDRKMAFDRKYIILESVYEKQLFSSMSDREHLSIVQCNPDTSSTTHESFSLLRLSVGLQACELSEIGEISWVADFCDCILSALLTNRAVFLNNTKQLTEFCQKFLLLLQKRGEDSLAARNVDTLLHYYFVEFMLPTQQVNQTEQEEFMAKRPHVASFLRFLFKNFPVKVLQFFLVGVEQLMTASITQAPLHITEGILRGLYEICSGMKPEVVHSDALCLLVQKLFCINFFEHSSPIIHLSFSELIHRLAPTLEGTEESTRVVFVALLNSSNGIRHAIPTVRQRINQIFAQLCFSLHRQLCPYFQELVCTCHEIVDWRISENISPEETHATYAHRRILSPTLPPSDTQRNIQDIINRVDATHWYSPFPATKFDLHEDITYLFQALGGLARDFSDLTERLENILESLLSTMKKNTSNYNAMVVTLRAVSGLLKGISPTQKRVMKYFLNTSNEITSLLKERWLTSQKGWILREGLLKYLQVLVRFDCSDVYCFALALIKEVLPVIDINELRKIFRLCIQIIHLNKENYYASVLLPDLTKKLEQLVPCSCVELENVSCASDNAISLQTVQLYYQLLLSCISLSFILPEAAQKILLIGITTHPDLNLCSSAIQVFKHIFELPEGRKCLIEASDSIWSDLCIALCTQMVSSYMKINNERTKKMTSDVITLLISIIRSELQITASGKTQSPVLNTLHGTFSNDELVGHLFSLCQSASSTAQVVEKIAQHIATQSIEQ